jgi:hypothetical protein
MLADQSNILINSISLVDYNFKLLTIINTSNLNFKENLNKYNHELSHISDKILIKGNSIKNMCNIVNKYEYIIYLDDYQDTSFNPEKYKLSVSLENKNIYPFFTNKTICVYNPNINKLPFIKKDNFKFQQSVLSKESNLLTIIVTLYNCEYYIVELLNSLENQTDKEFHVIIINDKSTDNTKDTFDYVIDKYSFTFNFYVNSENLGYAHCLGKAISLTDTPYFITLDGDDSLENNAIKIINNELRKKENKDFGFFYTNFWYCDENLNKLKKGFCKSIPKNKTNLECNCISHMRIFNKKSYYKTLGYIETNLFKNGAEDKDIFFKMEEICRIKFINYCLYNYRYNPNGLSKIGGLKQGQNNNQCQYLFEIAKKRAKERRNILL